MRLSTRIAVCVAVLVPLMVGLAGLLVLSMASHDLFDERDSRISSRLRALTPLATTFAQKRALPSRGAAAEERLTAAATDGGSGGVYIEVQGSRPLVIGSVPGQLPAPSGRPATSADGDWRYAAVDLGANGRRGRLWIFDPEARVDARVARLRERLVFTILAASVVGAAAGYVMGRIAVRPLTRLSREAAAMDRHSGGGRLPTSSSVTEVDDLAELVNDLLNRRDRAVRRTGEALETSRAFAATAAHELRTPLTSMHANIGLLSHPNLAPDDREEIIQDLAAEQARMQRMITMLRQLARGELVDPETYADVDLSALAGMAVEEARGRHPHASIVANLPEHTVRGWAEGLRLVVDNLLDNASVHGVSADGIARIEVVLSAEPGAALLRVRDRGPGIPAERVDRVFDRFTRRSGSPGSGLGMTLIHQQVVLHGGSITIEPPLPRGGASILIRLPEAPRVLADGDTLSWLTAHRP